MKYMLTKEQKLAALHNRASRYELALFGPNGERYLVQYTMGKSRHTILSSLQKFGEKVIRVTGIPENSLFTFERGTAHSAYRARIGFDWIAEYTGRTQREAITEGELPFIGSLAS